MASQEPSTVPPITDATYVGLGLLAAAVVVNSYDISPESLACVDMVTPLERSCPVAPINKPSLLQLKDSFLQEAPPTSIRRSSI